MIFRHSAITLSRNLAQDQKAARSIASTTMKDIILATFDGRQDPSRAKTEDNPRSTKSLTWCWPIYDKPNKRRPLWAPPPQSLPASPREHRVRKRFMQV